MVNQTIPKIRCREIADSDLTSVANLLQKGFQRRNRQFWQSIFELLARHPAPVGSPKYGYVLDSGGTAVGVVLTISSTRCVNNVDPIQCNLSSWYVEPAYRSYAGLFAAQIWKAKTSTFLNINPATHTRPIIEAQGFSRYSDGQFVAAPILCPRSKDVGVNVVRAGAHLGPYLKSYERDLILAHENYGCLSLCCNGSGFTYPFVFRRRIVKGFVPFAQVIYCRDVGDFVRFARPLGKFLALHGLFLVLVDSNATIPGTRRPLYSQFYAKIFQRANQAATWKFGLYGNRNVRCIRRPDDVV